eukprot:scaffold60231_cov38-Attheya_sp.AAC.1
MTRVYCIAPLAKETLACAKAPSILDEDKAVSVRDDKTEKFEKPIDRIRRKYAAIRRSKSSSSTKETTKNHDVDKQSPLAKHGNDKNVERPFDRIMKRFAAIRGVSIRSLKKSSPKYDDCDDCDDYDDYDDEYGDDWSLLVSEDEGARVGKLAQLLHKQKTVPSVMKASDPPAKFEKCFKNEKESDSSIMVDGNKSDPLNTRYDLLVKQHENVQVSPTASSTPVDKETMNANLGAPIDGLDESFNCLVDRNAALQLPSPSLPTKSNLFAFMDYYEDDDDDDWSLLVTDDDRNEIWLGTTPSHTSKFEISFQNKIGDSLIGTSFTNKRPNSRCPKSILKNASSKKRSVMFKDTCNMPLEEVFYFEKYQDSEDVVSSLRDKLDLIRARLGVESAPQVEKSTCEIGGDPLDSCRALKETLLRLKKVLHSDNESEDDSVVPVTGDECPPSPASVSAPLATILEESAFVCKTRGGKRIRCVE